MDPLTFDLVVTILATVAVLAAGGLAVWVLPWSDEDWSTGTLRPGDRPAPAREFSGRWNELIDLTEP